MTYKNWLGLAFLLLVMSCKQEVDLSQWQERENSTFKKSQLAYPRVREAYETQQENLQKKLIKAGILSFEIDIFLRAFKEEETLDLWGKAQGKATYQLLASYPFCNTSGTLGPKRREGDGQIPEGFYEVNHYNPKNEFLISLKVNYPNASDKIRSDQQHPGNDIYLHGGCATIGCIPITNPKIQEVYLLVVEAFRPGKAVPVHIFPFRFSDHKLEEQLARFPAQKSFWEELQLGYDAFEKSKKLPLIRVGDSGRYTVVR